MSGSKTSAVSIRRVRTPHYPLNLMDHLDRWRIWITAKSHLVAVLLRLELARDPFTSLDTQPRALNVLAVGDPAWIIFSVIALHPVVARIVADLGQFVREGIGLHVTRARVLLPK